MATSLFFGLAGSAVVGFLGTALLTRVIRGGAHQFGLLDRPTQIRNSHLEATPTGGGLAIAGGIIVAVATLFAIQGSLPGMMTALPFWGGAFLMLGAGLWDDKYDLDPKGKFVLQLTAAYLLLHAGVYLQVDGFSFAGGSGVDWALYSVPLSMIWVVGIINAVNLIDGLDGLATGVVGIAFLACAALFGVKGELGLTAVGIVMVGALVGFLPYNFNPASIFMGDSGSLLLGYLLAAYTLQGSLHADPILALLILPVLLGIPVLDTGVAIVRRLASDRTVFAPDRSHIHHQLVQGASERTAVLVLYGVGAWFGSAAFLMGILPAEWGYALAAGTGAVALVWVWRLGCFAPIPAKETPPESTQPATGETMSNGKLPAEESFEVLPSVGGDGSKASSVQAAPHAKGNASTRGMKILSVVGARPNFMKVAPLHRALEQNDRFQSKIVHTGQHYDEQMSDVFFRQLELPRPDVYLGVGSGSHAQQTARIMTAFEAVVQEEQPDLVVVVGDVNSTLACALVANKMNVQVAHVEAGLRSGDRGMPEEINRLVTDRIADQLFVTEQSGVDHLHQEGVADEKIFFVGNLMIDSLVQFREKAAETSVFEELGLEAREYALMTMHRPANVDHEEGVRKLLRAIRGIAAERPVVFPMHPRTRSRFEEFGLEGALMSIDGLRVLEPLGYLEFLRLMEKAAVVVTDSGGIQEETTFLGVPCLTLREHTERPVTIERGTNELLPLNPSQVVRRVRAVAGTELSAERPPYWDGRTAERIVRVLEREVRSVPGGDEREDKPSVLQSMGIVAEV